MKIAFVTDSPETISSHFGQAQHVVVVTLDEDQQEAGREVRDKAHHSHHAHDHGHDHDHGDKGSNAQLMDEGHTHPHHDHEHDHGHGHGRMFSVFEDCDVLIVRGMGTPAHSRATAMGLQVYMTGAKTVDQALAAYKAGTLDNDMRRVHSH